MLFLQHYIQWRTCSPGHVKRFQWNWEWCFSARAVWLSVQRDDDKCSFLKWTRPFWFSKKINITLSLLVHRNPAIWRWYPWFWPLSFEMLKILVQWILHKILNRFFTISPRSTTRPLYFWCFASQFSIFQMTYVPSVMQNELLRRRPCFIDHLLFLLQTCQFPRPKISPIFPIPCPPLLLLLEFLKLEAQEKFVNQIVMLQWTVSFSCNMVFMMIW